MVKPAAPWFRWGLSLWLVSHLVDVVALQVLSVLLAVHPLLTGAARAVAVGLLAVGVLRLVQHADRAAGVGPRRGPQAVAGPDAVGISDEERARQAEARARLAATGGVPSPPQ